jgi:hypothetical protein
VTFLPTASFGKDVIAVHYVPPADDKRLRGHRSLHGGADAPFLAQRSGGELALTLTIEKLKTKEHRLKLTVRRGRIVIGHDADGDQVATWRT